MKRLFSLLCCAALALLLLGGCFNRSPSGAQETARTDAALNVYASFYPMGDFAEKIGGEHVDVVTMVPSGVEPHDWEPTAGDIAGLEGADVFIYSGAGMEHWAQDVLSALESKDLVVVEASSGIPLIEGGDGDNRADPHVWLNPLYALVQLENIKDAFVRADPEHKVDYEANFARCADELKALDREYRETLAPIKNRDVIVAHQAFGYLCAAYGLNQIAIEGLSPDSEPAPARVAELIDFAKEHKIAVIFFEELTSPAVAETIADATGARTDVLSPLEGLSDEQRQSGADYFSIMRKNLEKLGAALSAAGAAQPAPKATP
ncbi:MAG: metal ABC transporter substrate-binding protein [Bacillota bacterium]